MLRALLEAGIRPTWSSAPASARSTARWSPATRRLAVVERLARAVAGGRRVARRVRRRPAAQVRRAVRTRTHLHSSEPLRSGCWSELGERTFEDLAVPFQCCAASIERAAEHWFTAGPVVDAVVASAAVPGLLPPVRVGDEHYLDGGIVNSIPVGRAVQLGADRIFVLQVGRIDRPLKRADASRGRWPGCRSRSRGGTGSPARWPSCPTTSRRTCCPPRAPRPRTTRSFAYRDFSAVRDRIDAAYDASRAYLDDGLGPARRCGGR